MDRKIRYFVNGWSFRLSFATRPGYDGDHEVTRKMASAPSSTGL